MRVTAVMTASCLRGRRRGRNMFPLYDLFSPNLSQRRSCGPHSPLHPQHCLGPLLQQDGPQLHGAGSHHVADSSPSSPPLTFASMDPTSSSRGHYQGPGSGPHLRCHGHYVRQAQHHAGQQPQGWLQHAVSAGVHRHDAQDLQGGTGRTL